MSSTASTSGRTEAKQKGLVSQMKEVLGKLFRTKSSKPRRMATFESHTIPQAPDQPTRKGARGHRKVPENNDLPVTPFRSLDLPAELRNRIYEYAVHQNVDEIFISKRGISKSHRPVDLISTCRQISNEALPVYFRVNNFRLSYFWIKSSIQGTHEKICRGSFGQRLKAVKTLRITTEQILKNRFSEERLTVDFESGLNNYTLQLLRWKGDPECCPIYWVRRLLPPLRQFLDDLVSEAVQRARTPILDGHGLLDLLKLLGDTSDRIGVWMFLDVHLGAAPAHDTLEQLCIWFKSTDALDS